MEEKRQNPDLLLQAVKDELRDKEKGRLKIFFGYAAGVGKTYAMLQAAHMAKEKGIDVVCGYIEPHARPETSALVEGLERLPEKEIEYGTIKLKEFDIDKAIQRNPQLILIDELAHTNAKGSRHSKRYQDVKELLNAGIDVYTTINVQHIESLNDMVASITGVLVRERIPDTVFDEANQVELVDIEPQDLIDRLNAGQVYRELQAKRALSNFFTLDNLTALREIALRRCADRVNLIAENARIKNQGDYHTEEHILVCLSSSPSNAKIIRTAARMAHAFRGNFTALFVESSKDVAMEEENKKRLREHIHLAEQLGAKVDTVYGDDVPYQIAEYARISGVSKIVLGRSAVTNFGWFRKPTLTDRVIQYAPNLDVYVIPDAIHSVKNFRKKSMKENSKWIFSPVDIGKCVLALVVATLIGLFFEQLNLKDTNIVAIYILSVLISAIVTKHQIYSVLAAFASVMTFNFFFTAPKYTFAVHDAGYPITFVIMFVVGILSSTIANKLKENARLSAQAAYRTKIMLDTNQLLQQTSNETEIANVIGQQLMKLLNRDIVIYLAKKEELQEAIYFPEEKLEEKTLVTGDNEKAVASWVLKNNKRAGATTDTLASAKCLYLAIRAGSKVYGVVGIRIQDIPLDSFENSMLLSILGEGALSLENYKIAQEKEEAAILARNEQLRSNLLRAISHDLRTPLTSISGNASNLMSNWHNFNEETLLQLFTDIYDDSMWLINLVENLLSVTRLEEGRLELNQTTEILGDIIEESLRHVNRKSEEHEIKVMLQDDLMLVKVDVRLAVQLMINLIDNAIKYTPAGSRILIEGKEYDHMVEVTVTDNGCGISDDQKEKVFQMFYCGGNKVADSRRSLGLGLSLCRSIVMAHGGNIWVTDAVPQGSCFHFTIPTGEVNLHE